MPRRKQSFSEKLDHRFVELAPFYLQDRFHAVVTQYHRSIRHISNCQHTQDGSRNRTATTAGSTGAPFTIDASYTTGNRGRRRHYPRPRAIYTGPPLVRQPVDDNCCGWIGEWPEYQEAEIINPTDSREPDEKTREVSGEVSTIRPLVDYSDSEEESKGTGIPSSDRRTESQEAQAEVTRNKDNES